MNRITLREVVGVLDILCGIILLVPRSRRLGAALAFVLLIVGAVERMRQGREREVGKGVICMGLCVVAGVF